MKNVSQVLLPTCVGAVSAFGQCTLNGVANPCVLTGPVTVTSSYSAGNDTATTVNGNGAITNQGTMTFTSAANNTILDLNTDTTLSGTGTVNLIETGGGAPIFQQSTTGLTLTNFDNLIQGAGTIGNGGLTVVNQSAGTISGNATGQTLFLDGSGGVTNQGVLKGTNSGTLELLSTTITNTGGNITADGGTVSVNSSVINGGTLNSINGGTLQTIANGVATLNGVTVSAGSTYTTGNDTDLFVSGTLTNNGTIQVNSAANNTIFGLNNNTTLTGGGTLTLSQTAGGAPIIQQEIGGLTLENVNNTIQGAGTIGNGGMTFLNDAAGQVIANATGQTLFLDGSGGITNLGLLKGTNGGTLELLSTTVGNAGANITADGGTVSVNSSVINGGTLNSVNGGTLQTIANGIATLNGVTLSTGSTYTSGNNTDLFVSGTITNNGNIQLNAAANNTIFGINTSTMLTGGGTITVSETGGGGAPIIQQEAGGLTIENVNNTIQGAGTIGNGGLTILNDASGKIIANASGQTLFLDSSATTTNLGLLKATNNGTLELLSTTVANAGANITADGGAVVLDNATVNGGTLTSANGGTLGTIANGIATLNGITLSTGSTYSSGNNTDLFVSGTITNNGTIQVSAAANNTILGITANTTLTGGGTVTLSQTGGGAPIVQQEVGNLTLTNHDDLIQGAGIIGNGSISIVNEAGGTINANSSGQTLFLDSSGSVTNNGLIEATSGGNLELLSTTVNNAGGNITGNGGTVIVSSATIQGGTLNGTLQTVANGIATLDGTTHGAITLSSGAIYTAGNNTDLFTTGTINNNGSLLVKAGANNTALILNNNTTLNGPGALTLSTTGGGAAFIEQGAGGLTLTNNSTIQGAGIIGNGSLTVVNGATGLIAASTPGQTLTINTSGNVTNNGTFQANAASTLLVTSPLSASTFSGTTLHTGTYNVFTGGTIQMNSLGATGGEIHSNNGTILLDGLNSNIVDRSGLDALSALSDNSGSFTIKDGRDFTSLSPFSNEGILQIGSGSTFFTGAAGSGTYTQTAGTTTVDGTLDPLDVSIIGGLIDGTGSIDGALTIDLGGAVTPGDAGSIGSLTDNGNFTLGSLGTLNINISGTGNDFLDVTGEANLGGTLDLAAIDGFTLAGGDKFYLLEDGTRSGTFTTVDMARLDLGPGLTAEVLYDQGAGGNEVELEINGAVSATPEPGTWFMLAVGLGALFVLRKKTARA